MWMRGGTSKGGYFLTSDLPADTAERDEQREACDDVGVGEARRSAPGQ